MDLPPFFPHRRLELGLGGQTGVAGEILPGGAYRGDHLLTEPVGWDILNVPRGTANHRRAPPITVKHRCRGRPSKRMAFNAGGRNESDHQEEI